MSLKKLPQRIAVIGKSGAGKTHLSQQLSAALGLPLIHIDAEYWQPGWQAPDAGWWTTRHNELIANEAWVMDGSFAGTLPARLARADLIVFLDLPRWRCLWGVLKRMLTTYGQVRSDMAPGCPERLDWEFLRYVWTWDREQRPRTLAAIDAVSGTPLIRIESRRDMKLMWDTLGIGAHTSS